MVQLRSKLLQKGLTSSDFSGVQTSPASDWLVWDSSVCRFVYMDLLDMKKSCFLVGFVDEFRQKSDTQKEDPGMHPPATNLSNTRFVKFFVACNGRHEVSCHDHFVT